MDFFQKFPRETVVTHLKSFLGVIRNIWHGRNALTTKKIRHLLEAQCAAKYDANIEYAQFTRAVKSLINFFRQV